MDEVKTHWDSMRIPPKMKYLMPIQHNPIHHHPWAIIRQNQFSHTSPMQY